MSVQSKHPAQVSTLVSKLELTCALFDIKLFAASIFQAHDFLLYGIGITKEFYLIAAKPRLFVRSKIKVRGLSAMFSRLYRVIGLD